MAAAHATPASSGTHRPLDIGVYGARGIPSTYSGYETFLSTLLPELAARGHRVVMYCRKGAVEDATSHRRVERVLLPALGGKRLNTLSHGFLAAMRARLARHDVVLVVNIANVPYCLLARASGQPTVLNTDGQEWLRGKWGALARRYFHTCARLCRFASPGVVTDSAVMAAIYRSKFSCESTVIPYSWEGVPAEPLPESQLSRHGLTPGQYIVIGGRLNPENNIHRVVDAYRSWNRRLPLVVLGAANYRSPITDFVTHAAAEDERILVFGHVSDRSTFATLVSQAAVYVHAHSVGGINPSLVEALGAGARVLALDTPFNREAAGSAASYFASFGQELLSALESSVAEPSATRREVRAAAAQRARDQFSLKDIADAYEALLLATAGRPPRQRTVMRTRWYEPPATVGSQASMAAKR